MLYLVVIALVGGLGIALIMLFLMIRDARNENPRHGFEVKLNAGEMPVPREEHEAD